MAKKTIEEALALFRSGKSPRECDKLTGINYKKIEREAKKLGYTRGDVSQLTASMARDKAEFVALPVAVQDIVTKEVEERTKHIQFFTNSTLKNCSIMMKKVDMDTEFAEHKFVQDTLFKGKETVLGKEPTNVINNTNAQQNISEKDNITVQFVGIKPALIDG